MKACTGQTNVPKGTTEGGDTHIDGNMRHWFDIIGKVNPSAIPSLQSIRHLLGSAFVSPIERKRKGNGMGLGLQIDGPTSGDSSSRINAPLVSTWIAFAVGNDGPEEDDGADDPD